MPEHIDAIATPSQRTTSVRTQRKREREHRHDAERGGTGGDEWRRAFDYRTAIDQEEDIECDAIGWTTDVLQELALVTNERQNRHDESSARFGKIRVGVVCEKRRGRWHDG